MNDLPLGETDKDLFASLPGGRALIDWFGVCPGFHDAELVYLNVSSGAAHLALRWFLSTEAVDANGVFVRDRDAVVVIVMDGVTGLRLEGEAGSILSELTVRRLPSTPRRADWLSCAGPAAGDIEVAFDTSVGLSGVIYAKSVQFELRPQPEQARGGVESADAPPQIAPADEYGGFLSGLLGLVDEAELLDYDEKGRSLLCQARDRFFREFQERHPGTGHGTSSAYPTPRFAAPRDSRRDPRR